jgi:hypothetical protein
MIIPKIPAKINGKVWLIIAGSDREFDMFCDQTMNDWEQFGITEFEGWDFIYYNSSDNIRGMRFDGYSFLGTGTRRNDVDMGLIRASMKPNSVYA